LFFTFLISSFYFAISLFKNGIFQKRLFPLWFNILLKNLRYIHSFVALLSFPHMIYGFDRRLISNSKTQFFCVSIFGSYSRPSRRGVRVPTETDDLYIVLCRNDTRPREGVCALTELKSLLERSSLLYRTHTYPPRMKPRVPRSKVSLQEASSPHSSKPEPKAQPPQPQETPE
jgi:hypothetical protein